MNEEELSNAIESITSDYGVEDADEGDHGYYAYVDGGYLPDTYQSSRAALQAIYDTLTQ